MNRTRIAVVASAILFGLRWYAADKVGFGDAEALYASYAMHPQVAYLDHPGLIGVIARALGQGSSPLPSVAHHFTAVVATAVPWIAAAAARALGASSRDAALAALSLLVVPEVAVGLFGLTPDLPLIVLWLTALGATGVGLQARPGSFRALAYALLGGAAAGFAFDAKVTGALLVLGLAIAWMQKAAAPHRKTLAPYAALALACVLMAPVVLDEMAKGFPMMRHRLIDTQDGAGPSLRNLAALPLGQLAYVTPPALWAALVLGRDLYARRRDDVVSGLLWCVTLAAGLPLVVLLLGSRVAEPHWLAPAYLALPLHWARRATAGAELLSPRLKKSAAAVGALVTAGAHLWVLTPIGPRVASSYQAARLDLATDLFAWHEGIPLVERALAESAGDEDAGAETVVVGPHWIVCAQVHAALGPSVLIGCDGPEPADFANWLPRGVWERARVIVYVTDDRFAETSAHRFPDRAEESAAHVTVLRGGRPVRRISVQRWVRAPGAAL